MAEEKTIHLVYHGAGLSGKTTNATYILDKHGVKWSFRNVIDDLTSGWGEIKLDEFKVRFYSTTGALAYDPSRFELVKKADGIVFVVDSQEERIDANYEKIVEMRRWLSEIGKNTPYIIQYNKRDLPNILSIEELEKEINNDKVPYFEAIAVNGIGVFETFEEILNKITNYHFNKKRQEL